MAVNVTVVSASRNLHVADVEATADADATATIPHGIVAPDGTAVIPEVALVTPLQQAPAAVSEWAVTTIDATNVVLTKGTAVGSGAAGAQVRATIMAPHSSIR